MDLYLFSLIFVGDNTYKPDMWIYIGPRVDGVISQTLGACPRMKKGPHFAGIYYEDLNPKFWSDAGIVPDQNARAVLLNRLILSDLTAIGMGLIHASRALPRNPWESGERLSNAWLIYPEDRDNRGKLR